MEIPEGLLREAIADVQRTSDECELEMTSAEVQAIATMACYGLLMRWDRFLLGVGGAMKMARDCIAAGTGQRGQTLPNGLIEKQADQVLEALYLFKYTRGDVVALIGVILATIAAEHATDAKRAPGGATVN